MTYADNCDATMMVPWCHWQRFTLGVFAGGKLGLGTAIPIMVPKLQDTDVNW